MNYTGYSIPYISGLTDDTIYSMDLQYSLSISIKRGFAVKSSPCLTTIFDRKRQFVFWKMKFKRVENYKEMNEIQTFIRVSINNLNPLRGRGIVNGEIRVNEDGRHRQIH
jgi:hypothetical protein